MYKAQLSSPYLALLWATISFPLTVLAPRKSPWALLLWGLRGAAGCGQSSVRSSCDEGCDETQFCSRGTCIERSEEEFCGGGCPEGYRCTEGNCVWDSSSNNNYPERCLDYLDGFDGHTQCHSESARSDVQLCVGEYLDCQQQRHGTDTCDAVIDACEHISQMDEHCPPLWPNCFSSQRPDAGTGRADMGTQTRPDAGSSSGRNAGSSSSSRCIRRSQCRTACNSRVAICDRCPSPHMCPRSEPISMERCIWSCEVGFDTANSLEIEINSCAHIRSGRCGNQAIYECIFGSSGPDC